MILLTIAIIGSILFLTVEIPVFWNYRDETDLEIILISAAMLIGSIIVLVFWR